MGNTVAIVGRPNVGKSTLFNRLVGERQAIMDNTSGVTRDRQYGKSFWQEIYFDLIDTGGYVVGSEDIFEEAIRKQVNLAMEEADVILFMVDVNVGIHGLDEEFANLLRDVQKPIIIVANKSDTFKKGNDYVEFYGLGLDAKIFPVSSQSGSGTGDLLEEVVTHFETQGIEDQYKGLPRIAIVGRPNVGKSSLLNALLGVERSIVTDLAGTTRDSIDSLYNLYDKKFILTDTAGIRKKAKINEDIEFYSILRSTRAIEKSDVCIVMFDASKGIESQDMHILGLVAQQKKGLIVLVNKWDLVEKETLTSKKFEDTLRERMAPIDYFPIIFTSVTTKQRIFKSIEIAIEVFANKTKKISTSKLNEILLKDIQKFPPPSHEGQFVNIKYITQLPTKSPTFLFFCNHPKYIVKSYERFLENRIREHFGFEGVPITLLFRKK